MEKLALEQNEKEMIEHINRQMEIESGMDRASVIASVRFRFINEVCQATVIKPKESKEHRRSNQLDAVLTGKYTGIPAFVGIMGLMFWLTFNVIGAALQSWLETLIGLLTEGVNHMLTSYGVNEA